MATHLKNLKTGRVFPATDELLRRGDLMPCDAQGNVRAAHEDLRPPAPERELTPYLGNLKNGRLLEYTYELALRPDLISVSSEAEWAAILEKNKPQAEEVPIKVPDAGAEITPEVIKEAAEKPEVDKDAVPHVFGLPNEAAKDALLSWASERHGVSLDRRLSVNNLREKCLELAGQKAA